MYRYYYRMMKFSIFLLLGITYLQAAPQFLSKYFPKEEQLIPGQIGVVLPPDEIQPYIQVIRSAAAKNLTWFTEYSKNNPADLPLPYHEKLGLSEEDYQKYLKLWDQRSFTTHEQIALKLTENEDSTWSIVATGPGFSIQALRFTDEAANVKSPNGTLVQTEQGLQSTANDLLGELSGLEWALKTESAIAITAENFALGKLQEKDQGYLIYTLQEATPSGKILHNKQILIRFPIKR